MSVINEEYMEKLRDEIVDLLGAEHVLRIERQDKEAIYRKYMAEMHLKRR